MSLDPFPVPAGSFRAQTFKLGPQVALNPVPFASLPQHLARCQRPQTSLRGFHCPPPPTTPAPRDPGKFTAPLLPIQPGGSSSQAQAASPPLLEGGRKGGRAEGGGREGGGGDTGLGRGGGRKPGLGRGVRAEGGGLSSRKGSAWSQKSRLRAEYPHSSLSLPQSPHLEVRALH